MPDLHEQIMTDRQMREHFPDLTGKHVVIALEWGIYKRESDDRWYLLDPPQVTQNTTV